MMVSKQPKILKDTGRTFKGLRVFLEGAHEVDIEEFYWLVQSFCIGKNSNFSLYMPYAPSQPVRLRDLEKKNQHEKE